MKTERRKFESNKNGNLTDISEQIKVRRLSQNDLEFNNKIVVFNNLMNCKMKILQ